MAEAGQNATVNLIDVDDIAGGNGRAVLNQALRDNRAKIQRLRAELEALNVIGLSGFDLDRVVATRVENDGSLTVFID